MLTWETKHISQIGDVDMYKSIALLLLILTLLLSACSSTPANVLRTTPVNNDISTETESTHHEADSMEADNSPQQHQKPPRVPIPTCLSIEEALYDFDQLVSLMEDLLPIDEILQAYNMPYMNNDDINELAYGYIISTSLNNIKSQPTYAPNIRPFNGWIWLLTSETNYSASAVFAHLSKYTGFATLVGTPVSGGLTSIATRDFGLENSGIIVSWDIDYLTDQYGRSLVEFPTTPHYEICENSDALEVALAKIRDLDD